MLLTKQSSNIDQFFTRGRHQKMDIYILSQSHFETPIKLLVKFLVELPF